MNPFLIFIQVVFGCTFFSSALLQNFFMRWDHVSGDIQGKFEYLKIRTLYFWADLVFSIQMMGPFSNQTQ